MTAPSPTVLLARRVARLRTRAGEGRLDRALLVAGGVLLPLGVLVVVLGWVGASRTVLVFEQIPYLVSGGLLGLALVFAGGFVYFTYWQTLLVRESRTHNRELIASLARIEALLAPSAQEDEALTLVATATGTMAHRADCQVVAGRPNLRRVALDDPSFAPCKICRPGG